MTLRERMRKNEFGYAFVDSPSLASKFWALENDWEALLICNSDHRNVKQVFNTMLLWRKTQSKKMMRYLNKQNFWVSYMDVRRQSKKLENDVLNGDSNTTPLLKRVSAHNSSDNVDAEFKSRSLRFNKL